MDWNILVPRQIKAMAKNERQKERRVHSLGTGCALPIPVESQPGEALMSVRQCNRGPHPFHSQWSWICGRSSHLALLLCYTLRMDIRRTPNPGLERNSRGTSRHHRKDLLAVFVIAAGKSEFPYSWVNRAWISELIALAMGLTVLERTRKRNTADAAR